MRSIGTSRRDYLKALTAGTLLTGVACKEQTPAQPAAAVSHSAASPPPEHDRRIQWWRDAKFGMFIHWGLYSQLGRQEWVMSVEDIPVAEYEKLAKTFKPKPDAARAEGMRVAFIIRSWTGTIPMACARRPIRPRASASSITSTARSASSSRITARSMSCGTTWHVRWTPKAGNRRR